ncbi:hypothetical protein [Psychroserpens sp.]
MKNLYSFIITALISNFIFAQADLYVDNNSFIYARDVVVFVNNDIRLETPTSNFYLRGDAQLLQNVDIKNSDAGELSVYQEQTKGIYEYNYWASPVGVSIDGTTRANLPFNGSNIHDPADHTDLANVNSIAYGYTAGYNGTTTELSNYWMWSLESAGGYNGWLQIFDTGNVNPGYGFTSKGSPNANNTLDFRGRPNNGDITFNCIFNGTDADPTSGLDNQVNTLTGNPYPSSLDLKLIFVNVLNNRTRLDGNIYFWEQKDTNSHNLLSYDGGYAVYAPGNLGDLNDNGTYAEATFGTFNGNGGDIGASSGLSPNYTPNNARRFAAIGQGFVVTSDDNSGAAGGGVITLNNSMRLYLAEDSVITGNGAVFGRLNSQGEEVVAMSHNGLDYMDIINNPTIIPEIRIHTKVNDLYVKQNVVAFRNNTDLSYNKFCDGKSISQLSDDVYFLADSHKLIIKSLAYEEQARIPLVFKVSSQTSTFSVTINQLTHVDDNINIYVYDEESNTYTDIKDGNFDISLPEGIYEDRFKVTFSNEDTLSTEEVTISDFLIFQDNNNSQLTIKNPNSLDINSISLFDVSGKQIFNAIDLDNKDSYSFSTENISDGVYVTVIGLNSSDSLSKKLIIKNK